MERRNIGFTVFSEKLLMRKWLSFILGGVLLVLLLVALPFTEVCAQTKPITLKMVSFLPPHFSTPKAVIDPLVDEVKKRSNGLLVINWIGGPEAVPMFDQPAALASGVIDLMFTVGTFYKDRVPENATLGISKVTPIEARVTGYYDVLLEAHKKANMYYLGQASYMSGYFIWLVKNIETPRDLARKKFPTDPTRDPFFKALGIIGVEMEDAEIYPGLDRGVIDGVMDPVSPAWQSKLHEVVNYVIPYSFFNSNAINVMNLDSWNKLPDNLKKTLMEAQKATEKSVRAKLVAQNEELYQKIINAGVKPIKFSDADAKWYVEQAFSSAWADVEKMLGLEKTARLRKVTGN